MVKFLSNTNTSVALFGKLVSLTFLICCLRVVQGRNQYYRRKLTCWTATSFIIKKEEVEAAQSLILYIFYGPFTKNVPYLFIHF